MDQCALTFPALEYLLRLWSYHGDVIAERKSRTPNIDKPTTECLPCLADNTKKKTQKDI